MEIKNLNNIPIEQIHSAFLSAFSNYEIQIDMPLEKFINTINAKSFDRDLSLGCFIDNELSGFLLIGFRERNHIRIGYDIATGVVEGYQNKGIGSRLLEKLISNINEENISQFKLEVLENNKSAIALYTKYQFKFLRKIKCYEREKKSMEIYNSEFTIGNKDDLFRQINEITYLSYEPTWQNELETYKNSENQYEIVTLEVSNELAAYGLIHIKEGDIMQLGILPEHRSISTIKYLLSLLSQKTESEKLRFINIDENSYLCDFLERIGFDNFVNQYEMIYENNMALEL